MIARLYDLRRQVPYRMFLLLRRLLLRVCDPVVRIRMGKRTIRGYLSSTYPLTVRSYPHYDSVLIRVGRLLQGNDLRPVKIIDIGANIGDTSILIDQEIRAEFLCIEGSPKYFRLLAANAGRRNNFHLRQATLGDGDERRPVALHVAGGTAYLGAADRTGGTTELTLMTLDRLLGEHPVFQDAQILKIDTDGYDYKILRGAPHFIARSSPVIYFELAAPYLLLQGEDPMSIFTYLRTLGYRRAILYDNTGFPLMELATDDAVRLESLIRYSLISDRLFYDVLLFPTGLGDDFFRREMDLFPPRHDLARKACNGRLPPMGSVPGR